MWLSFPCALKLSLPPPPPQKKQKSASPVKRVARFFLIYFFLCRETIVKMGVGGGGENLEHITQIT